MYRQTDKSFRNRPYWYFRRLGSKAFETHGWSTVM